MTGDVEFSEEMYVITKETAEAYLKSKISPASAEVKSGDTGETPETPAKDEGTKNPGETKRPEKLTFNGIAWSGEVPGKNGRSSTPQFCRNSPPARDLS